MRDQGRLVEWFDDKGYGFIQPHDQKQAKVFLHVKDFAQRGPRPIVGCALEYVVVLDGQKGYRAKEVKYLKAKDIGKVQQHKTNSKSVKNKHQPAKLKPMQMICVVYIIALSILSFTHMLPAFSLLFIILMNVLSYWLYAQDKEAAQQHLRRVPEQVLHIVAFLGGWPAAWLAQQKLHHKTQKQPFKKVYNITIVLNIILIFWIISPLNALWH